MRAIGTRRRTPRKYGVVEGESVRELAGHPYREIVTTSNVRPLAATQLLAPCEPTKIIAGGANYHGHLKEVGLAVPTVPVFFLKPPTSLIGPGQPVIYPPQTQQLEYEGELAVVVKSPMRNTPPGEVLKNLLGYTCVNDVTARDIQAIGGNLLHLCHSKSFDTFCPTGPWVETELDAHALDIELRINGEVRQQQDQHLRHDLPGRGDGELLLASDDPAAGRPDPHRRAARRRRR